MSNHRHLRRIRAGARAVFALGIFVSLAANVLHADPNIISQAIAAWAPIALFLTVELLTRVPVRSGWRTWLRIAATAVVAAIAAWVSYWHMHGVALRYGETGLTPYLLPISVDGLIVAASITLVEIGSRIHHQEHVTEPATQRPVPAPKPVTTPAPEPVTTPAPELATEPASDFEATSAAADTNESTPPVHLLPRARLIATAHHNATGQTITAADLAARINTTEPNARQLLATLQPASTPQRHTINGAAYQQEALL